MKVPFKPFLIAGRVIDPSARPFVIAELSGNHNGDLDRALALMDAAHAAGADAIKLQTYTADTMTIDHDGDDFMIDAGLWAGRRLYSLYQEAATPWEWHDALFAKAGALGIPVFSAPFDESAVDFLETLDTPAYKIASFEATDLPLIRAVAQTGKPIIISTGMADMAEIGEAVDTARANGCKQLVLLHCVSGYPAPAEDYNLRTIPDLAERYGVPVGLSDHTLTNETAVAAVALGAVAIEKHFTLARADGGPDAAFSLEPDEFRDLVRGVHTAWDALGAVDYSQKQSERENAVFRRSLYAVADIAAGETLTRDNIRSIRPGYGLAPKHLDVVLGRRAWREITRGTPLGWDLIDKDDDA